MVGSGRVLISRYPNQTIDAMTDWTTIPIFGGLMTIASVDK